MKLYCPIDKHDCPYKKEGNICSSEYPCDDFYSFWKNDYEYWENFFKNKEK